MEATYINKEMLTKTIAESLLGQKAQDFLSFLLDIDSNFLDYAFGYGDGEEEGVVDWDYLYSETKTYFIQELLKKKWEVHYGQVYLDENVLMVILVFEEDQFLGDFLMNGRLEKDTRTVFNQMEIYLNNHDMKLALEKGIIKNDSDYTWTVD